MILVSIIFFSTQACVEGENFCSKCNPITKLCVKCQKDIYSPDKSGGCELIRECRLENNYCMECSENGKLCEKCDVGYFPDLNGGCSLIENCEVSYKGECIKCKENYILVGRSEEDENYELRNKINYCKALNTDQFHHCIDIYAGTGTCNKCEEGYFLSYSDLKCTKIKNCAYSSYGDCKKCDYGYYFNRKEQACLIQEGNFTNCKISSDGEKCSECDKDTFLDERGICAWSNFCSEGDRYHCNKCIEGYYLTMINGICTTEEHCMDGRKDLGICTHCKEFYCTDFKDGKCIYNLNDDDYKFCSFSDKGGCYQCIGGAFLTEDGKCVKTSNCKNGLKGNCTQCKDNYYLGLDNKCTNIEKCIYSDNDYNCIECEGNFFYDKVEKICKIGEGKYSNCKYGNENNCERCKDNYYLNQTDNLCYSNEENEIFNKCAVSDDIHCIQCLEGFYLAQRDNKCSLVQNCLVVENENKCLFCEEGYCADGKSGKCEFNFLVISEDKKFMYRCNRTDIESTACEICLDGYELKDGLCVDERHCSEKNDEGDCIRCDKIEGDNYEQCLNDVFGCVETMFYENCLECFGLDEEIGTCSRCIEGYEFGKYGFCEPI